MSRIGNTPIIVPNTITLITGENIVAVKGPKGELAVKISKGIRIEQKADTVFLSIVRKDKNINALQGVTRANLANAIYGVTKGWTKNLELVGVGYRATINGANLQLSVGFSHPVTISPPPGITFKVTEGKIEVSGTNKQLVGEICAQIRNIRKPEPYKGKGIRYVGEYVRKKAGKAAKAVGGSLAGAK